MPLRRIAFWSGVGLLALIVSAASWLLLADLGQFKPQIERWASEKTGRSIAINGALHIDLAQRSSVIAEDIHIANADWADAEEMLSVGRVEIRVDLRSLFSGPLIIELIDIDDVNLLLIESPQGARNWQLVQQSGSSPTQESDKRVILLQQIDLDRINISVDSPRRVEPLSVSIAHFEQQHRDDDFLDLAVSGTINGRRAELNGQIGSWAALRSRHDVYFDFDARLDTFEFSADGFVDDLLRPRRPTVNFAAHAPDINDLLSALGVVAEGRGKIDLSGSLAPQQQGPLVLRMAGQLGRLDIDARGEFSDLQNLEEVDIELLASSDDVRPILETLGLTQRSVVPLTASITVKRNGKRFIIEKSDLLLGEAKVGLAADLPNFPTVDDASVRLQIDGPDLQKFKDLFGVPGSGTGPFSLAMTVDVAESGAEIVSLNMRTDLGEIHADGNVGVAPDYFGSTLNFRVLSDSLQAVGTAYGAGLFLPDVAATATGGIMYDAEGIRTIEPVQASIDDLQIRVGGLIKPVRGLVGSTIRLEVSGPSLAASSPNLAALVASFAVTEAVLTWPFDLGGDLQIRAEGFRFLGVNGSIGDLAMQLDGLLVPGAGIVGSRFDVAANGAAFEELFPDTAVVPGPYEFAGHVEFGADRISLRNLQLRRATGKLALNLELGMPVAREWANFDLQASGADVRSFLRRLDSYEADLAPFSIALRGERRGSDWTISQLEGVVGAATISASGNLDLGEDARSSQFDLKIDVPSTAALGTYDGSRIREQAFTLNASIVGSQGVLEANDLTATLGSSVIEGFARYRAGAVPDLSLQISSDSLVFSPLLEPSQKVEPALQSPNFEDGRLIPDIAVPFAAMQSLNAAIKIDVATLERDALHVRDIVLRADLRDGILEVSELRARARSGALTARAKLDPAGGEGQAMLEFVARDLAFGSSEMNRDLALTGDIDISLSSTGSDLRTLLGNANGVAFIETRGGRIPRNGPLQAIYGSLINEILGAINPFSKSDPYTQLECVIIPLQIESGVVQSAPSLLITSDKIRMASVIEVDLKDESLEMNVRTTPRKGISFSAGEIFNPYIKIVGTLAAPTLAVDEAGVLISGSVAVATGGLSILLRATWDRVSRSKDPCQTSADEGKKALGDRFPTLLLPATNRAPVAAS